MAEIETPKKSPDTFVDARLLAKDFDGTVALTFEKSPAGMDVHEAYNQAIDEVFGPDAVDTYHAGGGLKNRAPIEVVQSLVPDAPGADLNRLVAKLTDSKLAILMGEIGTRFDDGSVWPRPTNGYLELLEELTGAKNNGVLIDSLILSSGHEPFIRNTYDAWGVDQPDYVVAQERLHHLGLASFVKPSTKAMDAALLTWAEDYNTDTSSPGLRDRVVYVGDDDEKDGEMARQSGIDFFLISPESAGKVWPKVATRIGLTKAASRGIQVNDK